MNYFFKIPAREGIPGHALWLSKKFALRNDQKLNKIAYCADIHM